MKLWKYHRIWFRNVVKNVLGSEKTYLIWKELLVPLWSRSWHRHAIIKARHSISPNIFHHWVACKRRRWMRIWNFISKLRSGTVAEICFPSKTKQNLNFLNIILVLTFGIKGCKYNNNHINRTYRQNWKHHLSHIEGMPPIMISNVPVVLFHTQQPPAQNLIIDVKALYKVQVKEHSQASLETTNQYYHSI